MISLAAIFLLVFITLLLPGWAVLPFWGAAAFIWLGILGLLLPKNTGD